MKKYSETAPTFSLVFLLWNTGEPILRTLDSVLEQSYSDYEIVLVDNDSQDDTLQLVRDAYDDNRIQIVKNERNLGFSRGINRGIEKSNGQYICCYNHDTVFPDSYLQVLSEHITPDAVWTTARQNHRVSSEQTCVRLLSRYRFTIPYTVDSLSGIASVNYIPGDGTIIPREIYHRELDATVFDSSMPTRGEDVDLSLRLANRGVPMRAVLDTYSIHPDKSRMYAPTIQNFINLAKTIQARIAAHRKNDGSLSATTHAATSIVTNPLVIYFTSYPRSEESFIDATSLR